MKKIKVTNFRLQRFGAMFQLMWCTLSLLMSFGIVPTGVALISEIIFLALGILYLVKWSKGNRIVVKNDQVTFYDWEKGFFYLGLWSKTVKTSFNLGDIQQVSYTTLGKLTGDNSSKFYSNFRDKTQKTTGDLNKIKVLCVTSKEGNFHVSNVSSFHFRQLGKLLGTLGCNGVKVQTAGI